MNRVLKILIVILVLGGALFLAYKLFFNNLSAETDDLVIDQEKPQEEWFEVEIEAGQTYSKLMEKVGVDYEVVMQIFAAAEPIYDLSKIRAGRKIELLFDKDGEQLKELVYKIDSEEELIVTKQQKGMDEPGFYEIGEVEAQTTEGLSVNNEWQASKRNIPYQIKINQVKGVVESSVYEAAMAAGIDERAIIEYAYAFQWSVDFAMDPRVGDTFKLIYEERYLNGEYVMPGRILAGSYNNQGQQYLAYYFEETADNQGYFDEEGNSVQKMFLKAPLEFKYISSPFTTGLRYIEAFNVSTGHRAIDYAASYGTPIRTVGDGTVVFVGWDGGYGNKISIRHNGTYTTNYAHLSKFAVKRGQKVEQGQTIGYVGSTGFSTGPHLHFEMVKNGVKINPMTEILPPGEPIAEENRERFFRQIDDYKKILDEL